MIRPNDLHCKLCVDFRSYSCRVMAAGYNVDYIGGAAAEDNKKDPGPSTRAYCIGPEQFQA